MEAGFYSKYPIDFRAYRVSFFKWPTTRFGISGGCGANALSVLTGVSPQSIVRRFPRQQKNYTDKFMVDYLSKKGYKVIPLTLCSLSEGHEFSDNRVSKEHVLLVSQLYLKNEASWVVMYNGQLMHNFFTADIYPLEFLNRPILSAYIVFHTKWFYGP